VCGCVRSHSDPSDNAELKTDRCRLDCRLWHITEEEGSDSGGLESTAVVELCVIPALGAYLEPSRAELDHHCTNMGIITCT